MSLILRSNVDIGDGDILSVVGFSVLAHPAFYIYTSLLQTVGRFHAIVKSLAKSTNQPNAQKPPAELRV